jgi:hypothetical protein
MHRGLLTQSRPMRSIQPIPTDACILPSRSHACPTYRHPLSIHHDGSLPALPRPAESTGGGLLIFLP